MLRFFLSLMYMYIPSLGQNTKGKNENVILLIEKKIVGVETMMHTFKTKLHIKMVLQEPIARTKLK